MLGQCAWNRIPVFLQGQADGKRIGLSGSGRYVTVEGYGIKARFSDGELGVAGGVGDSCADDSGVLIKIKRSSAGTRSGWGGVSGEQLGGCGSTGRPGRTGRSSCAGWSSCAGRSGCAGWSNCAGRTGRPGYANCAGRTGRPGYASRASRAGRSSGPARPRRGDVKRKVAINPQTMGNYKKIKSITLRMEPSGTTWAAFLCGQDNFSESR